MVSNVLWDCIKLSTLIDYSKISFSISRISVSNSFKLAQIIDCFEYPNSISSVFTIINSSYVLFIDIYFDIFSVPLDNEVGFIESPNSFKDLS